MRALDLQHGDVEIRIGPPHDGREFAPVQQVDRHLTAPGDDVGIGEHVAAAAVHDDAGAQADPLLPAGGRHAAVRLEARPEELFQRAHVARPGVDDAGARDVDHGGRGDLHRPHHGRQARTAGRDGGGRGGLLRGGRRRGAAQEQQADRQQRACAAAEDSHHIHVFSLGDRMSRFAAFA